MSTPLHITFTGFVKINIFTRRTLTGLSRQFLINFLGSCRRKKWVRLVITTKMQSIFFDRTINADVQDLYQKFLKYIPKKGRILDAGCGIGRDSRFLA
jgi:SAM-dependent methyltransferase